MADTGCQSCLAGINIIEKLCLPISDLIPVSMKMHAANEGAINIHGAVILRITGTSPSGDALNSHQIVYITDSTDKFFLSRSACSDLGIISSSFPTIGEAAPIPSSSTSSETETTTTTTRNNESPCDCPTRQSVPRKPTSLPFPATDENREKLQNWLLQYYNSSTFNTCPHQPLPMMNSPPLRLMIDPDAIPVAHHTPVPVPIHWHDRVKEMLDQDVNLGVIEPVPIGEPVTWCHRMVVCAKKDGSPRRTVDFQSLNKYATRETHHTKSPFHQARSVPRDKKKTVFDCWNGYHSIPLHPDDRHFTTFITPWGRYRYKCAPQGYISSGDGFTRRFDAIIADFPDMTKCIDDSLLWANTIEESFYQACSWLDICGTNGITLNPKKFQFAQDVVEFAGFEITPSHVRPNHRFIESIRSFPTPCNIHDIRSWFGLINQVSYAFASSPNLAPFRHLLRPNTPFTWDTHLQQIFDESKDRIACEIQKGILIFNKN